MSVVLDKLDKKEKKTEIANFTYPDTINYARTFLSSTTGHFDSSICGYGENMKNLRKTLLIFNGMENYPTFFFSA